MLVDPVDGLRAVMQKVKSTHTFHINADMVILPDHLYGRWTLTVGDADDAMQGASIKAEASLHLPKDERRSERRTAKGEQGTWLREHLIRDERDSARHAD